MIIPKGTSGDFAPIINFNNKKIHLLLHYEKLKTFCSWGLRSQTPASTILYNINVYMHTIYTSGSVPPRVYCPPMEFFPR